MNSNDIAQVLASGKDRSRVERAGRTRDWLVYGAGRTGRAWAKGLADRGLHVHAFIDRAADGRQVADLPVHALAGCPDELRRRCAVLVALHNPGTDVAAVRRELVAAGYTDVWLLQDLIDAWPGLSHFWLAPADETLPHAGAISDAFDALADDQSRTLLVALLDQRLNGNAEALPPPDPDNHYLPAGIPKPPMPLRFIDCGAYTGDTIEGFGKDGVELDEVAAFEPDAAHFVRLCAATRGIRASVFPCGVWREMAQLRFSSDDAASHIDPLGEIMVQVVALDQALPRFAPGLIKMDIEGAEANALRGARGMIEEARPHLANSAYHTPRDLWELMLLVHNWDLGYRFRLRNHSHNGFDTVLYGEPA